ncbi:hypothetical protein GCU68_06950 [Natronorubrum aibiense]|uniref:Uncharacterized protein n=2 Tax=Natronorubrum aibiense TaxID=348826 RepID=A0A5P9P2G6_9EURY|nr:hypothetical protein GCU68_06950 [Natronorubrum aibiense]
MDTFERAFKLGCTAVFAFVFSRRLDRTVTALLLGHSLNFLLNSHAVSALRSMNLSFYTEWDEFDAYATNLLDNLTERSWVKTIYVTGSLNDNRNEWQPGSDLDVIVIRKPGITNGIKAVFGALLVRFSATVNLFPLDIYFFDKEGTLEDRLIDKQEKLIPYSNQNNRNKR